MARILKRIAALLLAIVLLLVLAGWWLLRGSLPALDGELALPGLSAGCSPAAAETCCRISSRISSSATLR